MSGLRAMAGWLCIAMGFALVVLLALGVFDPTIATSAKSTSLTPVFIAMLPSVSFGIALFALGVWLVSTRKKST